MIQELILTSLPPRNGCHPYPQHELRSGDDRKPGRDGDIFHRHGVYPVTTLLGIDTKLLNDEMVPNLRVNTICARRVQRAKMKRGYQALLSHLCSLRRKNGEIKINHS